ncbi:MAG: hypothetical protein FP827_08295 [Candidatus Omnitrophica bacterium]|nr:hypothetical protein [Candidatus Omnitrophota bacterium]
MRNKIMKLAGLGWMVLAVSYVNALNIEQTKGPRIVLEEEEITLMEDGKEIQKILVSESSQEKDEILNMVREKVLRKLGVKSDQEIRAGELWDQYNGEVDKLLKVEKVKDRKLKFIDIDKDGKAFKEVILRTEFRIDEELDKSKKNCEDKEANK